mgnify:CR=1
MPPRIEIEGYVAYRVPHRRLNWTIHVYSVFLEMEMKIDYSFIQSSNVQKWTQNYGALKKAFIMHIHCNRHD